MRVELQDWPSKGIKEFYAGDRCIMNARGDYMYESLVGKTPTEVIDTINDTTVGKYNNSYDDVDDWKDCKKQLSREAIRNEKRRAMHNRLIKVGHYGPYEHGMYTFAVEGISRVCATQLRTHRHATFDQQSMRYVKFEDIEVDEDNFRYPDEFSLDEKAELERAYDTSLAHYKKLIGQGVGPEKARFVLPLGFKTNLSFSLNARSLMHIIDMRHAGDAQDEIRTLMDHVLDEFESKAPFIYESYNRFGKGASKKAP